MLLTLVIVCLAAPAVLIAVPAYIAFATHNRLVALDQRCDTAFGDIDVHLKHRHNLIPPLVETVRESNVLADFPGRTEADLYLWLIEHRWFLEQSGALDADAPFEDVVREYAAAYSPRLPPLPFPP